ncbi:unnamed protein product, partial [Effrenium voratum]
MEPSSGFYWDPVLVLDFKGMYPSLIVAHNLSFDTCLGHSRRTAEGPTCSLGVSHPWQLGAGDAANVAALFGPSLEDEALDSPVRLAASGSIFVGPQVKRGLLPLMLAEVLQMRAQTKRLAKQKSTSPAVAKRLEHKQFALKYFANVTYGYSSASFSGRMPCAELADAIVATGRRALEEAANFIEANWAGAKVIYGDTDSVFVQLKGYSLEEAFQTGRKICAEVSAKHPAPVELEFEKVYLPCLCLTKKRYGGLAYAKPPSEGGSGVFEAKGLEAIRRDQCRMASNVQNEVLNEFFRTKDLSAVKRIFVAHATDLLKGSRHTVADLSFFREVRLGTYRAEAEDGGSATLPPQAAVAMSKIAAEGEAAAPEYGERASFAVSLGNIGARLVDRSVPPPALAEAGAAGAAPRLDRWWYVEKALLPSVSRILHSDLAGLPPALDVTSWLHKVPRPCVGSRSSPLGRLFRPVCRKCGLQTEGGLCKACAGPALRDTRRRDLLRARRAAEEVQRVCVGCAGPLWRSCAAAEFCPVLTRRAAAEAEVERLAALLGEEEAEVPLEPAPDAQVALLLREVPTFEVDSSEEDAGCEASGSRALVKQEDPEGPAQPDVEMEPAAGAGDVALCLSSGDEGEARHAADAGPTAVPTPNCQHQEPCRKVEVKKEGPNKGRYFFACPRPREQQCDFFAWADQAPKPTRPTADAGTPRTPRRRKAQEKATPAKRRRTVRPEGRLERFVPKPSRRVRERIERAKEHRLQVITLKVVERGEIAAEVVGHTGNVYSVRIGARVSCNCLDFGKARTACKHLLFLLLRVLQLSDDDPRLWQRALLPRELSDLRARLESQPAEVQAPEHVVSACREAKAKPAEPCPVCFDPVESGCTCACGRNLHAE